VDSWKTLFDKNHKPVLADINSYFTPQTKKLFDKFVNQLGLKAGFGIEPVYTKTYGWTFKIGLKYIRVSTLAIKEKNSFYVGNFCVKNRGDDERAINTVLELCNEDFKAKVEAFEIKRIKRNQSQIERTKKRLLREKDEFDKISHLVNPAKLNHFKWAPRVSLNKLRRLYQSSARMLLDEELLLDIGYTLYFRCLQGKEERELYYDGKIKCHHCGQVIGYIHNNELTQCECGYQYIPREYIRSYSKEWMPHGRAQPVFDKYIDQWPSTKTNSEKMNLIDWIIHECHKCLITGAKAHSVAKNLLGGTRVEAENLILELAYGDVLKNQQPRPEAPPRKRVLGY
jgi:hypothetical protein